MTIERCALCQEPIEYLSSLGGSSNYMHMGNHTYDHGAVRQRNDPQPYEPYDESEQSNGNLPQAENCDGSGQCDAVYHTHGCWRDNGNCEEPGEHVTDDVPNYSAETVENPKVPLISTTEDYHGQLAEKLKVDVEVRQNTRLFLVYLAALVLVLAVATATYGLLQATPWPLSWWSCLALTLLFRIGVLFGRWRFSG